MRKIFKLALCIIMCIVFLSSCVCLPNPNELSNYRPELSYLPLLNSLDNTCFEYNGCKYYSAEALGLDELVDYSIDSLFRYYMDRNLINVDYFQVLVGRVQCMHDHFLIAYTPLEDCVFASRYDPEMNVLMVQTTHLQSAYTPTHFKTLFFKDGYTPYSSIYDISIKEIFRTYEDPELTVPEINNTTKPFYFREKIADLSSCDLTLSSVIDTTVVYEKNLSGQNDYCDNVFMCSYKDLDFVSVMPRYICFDDDKVPYIYIGGVNLVLNGESKQSGYYRVKEEYRDIFAWEYFGCEGHIDPDAKYDPDNEGTENPGGEGES